MSIVLAAMVEPHQVVRGSCQTIVIPVLNLFFCHFFLAMEEYNHGQSTIV